MRKEIRKGVSLGWGIIKPDNHPRKNYFHKIVQRRKNKMMIRLVALGIIENDKNNIIFFNDLDDS